MKTYKTCWYKNSCKKYNTEECNNFCSTFDNMLALMINSGLPSTKFNPINLAATPKDFENYSKLNDIRSDIFNFVKHGKNLIIWSDTTGNGKTSWSIKLLHKYLESVRDIPMLNQRGFFLPTQAFLLNYKNISVKTDKPLTIISAREEKELLTFENLYNADLIIWDEVGLNTLDPRDFSILYTILDARHLRGKSNIFTCGCSPEKLKEIYGSQLSSRILYNCEVINLVSDDFRINGIDGDNA